MAFLEVLRSVITEVCLQEITSVVIVSQTTCKTLLTERKKLILIIADGIVNSLFHMVNKVCCNIVLTESSSIIQRTLERPLMITIMRYSALQICATFITDCSSSVIVIAIGINS